MWITKTFRSTKNDRATPSEKPLKKSKTAPDGETKFLNRQTHPKHFRFATVIAQSNFRSQHPPKTVFGRG
jgi:hypothetical protein